MKKIGIYNPYLETRGGGERIALALAAVLSEDPEIKVSMITHAKADIPALGTYFDIDLAKVDNFIIDVNTRFLKTVNRLPLPGRIRNLLYDARARKVIRGAGYDVFINNCIQSNMPCPAKYGVYMCMFPQFLKPRKGELSATKRAYVAVMEGLNRLLLHPGSKNALETYRLVTANSAYTQGYIKKRWNRESEILYPYGEDMLQKDQKKRKVIVSVGRFFADSGENHNKRHDVMVREFKQLTDLHKQGWELHLAGSVAEDIDALKYILNLMKESQGFPVYFHFNASFKELKNLYNESTIYWHATGYGSDPKKHPEKQEHFGITTVESMSARCVPVVIDSAGQRESVSHDKNGFLWSTPKELHEFTRKVAGMNQAELKKWQDAARDGYTTYDKQAFERSVKAIFEAAIS